MEKLRVFIVVNNEDAARWTGHDFGTSLCLHAPCRDSVCRGESNRELAPLARSLALGRDGAAVHFNKLLHDR